MKDFDFFDMSVTKNFSFDRKENPYKFDFTANEPEDSKDSAFEIFPKSLAVGSKEIKTFTVTFYSNKGVGEFNSLILATPRLTEDELLIADDKDEFSKKGSLGVISLNLHAVTIDTHLSIDKKTRVDGDNHVLFKCWSVPNEDGAPSNIKKLTYYNETKADLTFNLNVTGPFEIVKTKSNTGATHPLSTVTGTQSKGKKTFLISFFLSIEEEGWDYVHIVAIEDSRDSC